MQRITAQDFSAWIDHLLVWMLTTDNASQMDLFRATNLSQAAISNYRKAYREKGELFNCRLPMIKAIAAAHDKIERQAALANMKARPTTITPPPKEETISDGQSITRRRRKRRSRIAGRHAP